MTRSTSPSPATDPTALETRLGRLTDATPWRLLIAARSWLRDLLVVVPATVLAVIAALTIGHTDVSPAIGELAGDELHLLLELRAQDWYPALLAGAVLLACLRLRTHGAVKRTEYRAVGEVLAGVAIFGFAASELAGLPGGLAHRFVPLALAAYAALYLPHWRRRIRRGGRTVAGCRPSRRAHLTPRGRGALRILAVDAPSGGRRTTTIVDDGLEPAMSTFARTGDTTAEAYAWARIIEHRLAQGQIVAAEQYVRRANERDSLVRTLAVASATAQYLAAVGRHTEALTILLQVRQTSSSRMGAAFESLVIQVAAGAGSPASTGGSRTRARYWMIIAGHPGAVLLDLATEIRGAAPGAPDEALSAAHQLCEVIQAVLAHPLSRVGDDERWRVEWARGIALATIGSVCERHDSPSDAANAYLDAVPALQFAGDRAATRDCLTRAAALRLEHGQGTADQEAHALDIMCVALELVAAERGGLRTGDRRAAWVHEQRELYAASLQRLAHDFHRWPAKAAERGLWLIESLHRTTVAAAIRSELVVSEQRLEAHLEELARAEAALAINSAGLAPTAHGPSRASGGGAAAAVTKARLALTSEFPRARDAGLAIDPVDVGAVRTKVGAAVAVLYQCGRDDTGWTINCVTVCPDGEYLFQGRLPVASNDPSSSPCALLDAIAGSRLGAVARAFSVPLRDELWRLLEAGILPPNLDTVLEQVGGQGGDVEVVLVPDGPLAGLAFTGLRLRDGRALGERARVRMLPALSLLEEDAYVGPVEAAVVVKHVDEARADSTAWQSPRAIVVRDTANADELATAMAATPAPDLVAILAHGRAGATVQDNTVLLRNGALSAADALALPWSPAVLLGSCWLGGTHAASAEAPYGLPTACLLRGARTLVAPVSPTPRPAVAEILDRVARERPAAGRLADAVRSAMATSGPGGARWIAAPPTDGACVMVWSTVALSGAGVTGWRSSSWDARELPRPAVTGVLRELTLSVPLAPEARMVLQAAAHDNVSCVAASDVLRVITADDGLYAALPGANDVVRVARHVREPRSAAAVLRGETRSSSIRLTADAASVIRRAQELARERRLSELPVSLLLMSALSDQRLAAAVADDLQAKRFGEALLDVLERRDSRAAVDPGGQREVTYDAGRIAKLEELATRPVATGLRYSRRVAWGAAFVALALLGSSLGDIVKFDEALRSPPESRAAPADGYLGIQVAAGPTGAPIVKAVVADSPASRAGLRAGDRVMSIDGYAVGRPEAVIALIRRRLPGQVVRLIVMRNARSVVITGRVAARP